LTRLHLPASQRALHRDHRRELQSAVHADAAGLRDFAHGMIEIVLAPETVELHRIAITEVNGFPSRASLLRKQTRGIDQSLDGTGTRRSSLKRYAIRGARPKNSRQGDMPTCGHPRIAEGPHRTRCFSAHQHRDQSPHGLRLCIEASHSVLITRRGPRIFLDGQSPSTKRQEALLPGQKPKGQEGWR
jgi:hypothetical protein